VFDNFQRIKDILMMTETLKLGKKNKSTNKHKKVKEEKGYNRKSKK
jgi:hypothetical protein